MVELGRIGVWLALLAAGSVVVRPRTFSHDAGPGTWLVALAPW